MNTSYLLTEEERKKILNMMLAKAHKRLCDYVEGLMTQRIIDALELSESLGQQG